MLQYVALIKQRYIVSKKKTMFHNDLQYCKNDGTQDRHTNLFNHLTYCINNRRVYNDAPYMILKSALSYSCLKWTNIQMEYSIITVVDSFATEHYSSTYNFFLSIHCRHAFQIRTPHWMIKNSQNPWKKYIHTQ